MKNEMGLPILERFFVKNISTNFLNEYSNTPKIDPSYGEIKKERFSPSDLKEYSLMSHYDKNKIYYKLNKHGHRCEEFETLNKNKTNILFAGCSVTFGEALPEGYTWDNHVYNKIKKINSNIGPFHSLGYPGNGTDHIVDNIIGYCNNFGNPNIIYVLLPDYGRMKYWDSNLQSFETIYSNSEIDYSLNQKDLHDFLLECVRSIQRLEYYCTINNISLFLTSWDAPTSYILSKLNLKCFISLYNSEENPQLLYPLDYKTEVEPYSGCDFLFDAADSQHYGLMGQLSFAKTIYEKSKETGVI
jgi:hypothetical protein